MPREQHKCCTPVVFLYAVFFQLFLSVHHNLSPFLRHGTITTPCGIGKGQLPLPVFFRKDNIAPSGGRRRKGMPYVKIPLKKQLDRAARGVYVHPEYIPAVIRAWADMLWGSSWSLKGQ